MPFPDGLRGELRRYTCPDLDTAGRAGYEQTFMSVELGVREYIKYLTTVDR